MYKKIITLSSFWYILVIFIGCLAPSSQPIKKVYTKCKTSSQFIESHGSDEILLRAVGKGKKVIDVKLSAMQDALCFVLTKGSKPILALPQEREKFSKIADSIYNNINLYASIKGGAKSRQEEDGLFLFEYIVAVQITTLRQDLVKKNVIANLKSINKKLGNQSFTVISQGKNKYDNISIGAMNDYLTNRKFKTIRYTKPDKRDLEKIKAILVTIYDGEKDFINNGKLDKIASMLNAKADVYITLKTTIHNSIQSGVKVKKATVRLDAYEVSTDELIAGYTGHSPTRASNIDTLLQEATNDAANEVTKGVQIKWQDYIKDGKPFRILLVAVGMDDFTSIESSFYDALDTISENVDEKGKGVVGADYVIKVKNIAKGRKLFKKISKAYRGAGNLYREQSTNNFLLIKIAESDLDIEIN
jgi:hypothetical protein